MKKSLWLWTILGLSACQTAENLNESMTTLSNAQAAQAVFGKWQLRHYADGKQVKYPITLEISAEKNEQGLHQLSGKAPVNFYFAQAQLLASDNSIRLQGVGSTKMAGPPEAMEQEMRYFQRLADIRHYLVSADQNTLVLSISTPQTEKITFSRVSR